MNAAFAFRTDAKSAAFCEEIAAEIAVICDCGRDEAVARINRFWRGQDFLGDHHITYHDAPEHWAKLMCYGPMYWRKPPEALTVIPLP